MSTTEELKEKYCSTSVDGGRMPPGFCSHVVHKNVEKARGVFITEGHDLLVLERNQARVVLLPDEDGDLVADSKLVVAAAPGLNHGLVVHDGFIYASSSSTVYRWPESAIADAKARNNGENIPFADFEIVIHDMNDQICADCGAPQGHETRTLAVDAQGRLYVSVGSVNNIDTNSFRARIRRFILADMPEGGFDFESGEVFADGLRNEVGIEFDGHGVLWGVENGADKAFRADLGGDIHNDNPAEELNRFPDLPSEELATRFYGYPFCFSEFFLPEGVGEGPTAQWAWDDFKDKPIDFPGHFLDGVIASDEFCKTQVVRPEIAFQAHSAPLGLTFATNLTSEKDEDCFGGFPPQFQNDAFVTFHGSWNRDIPTGRKVVRQEFDEEGNPVPDSAFNLFCNDGDDIFFKSGLRPVDVVFDRCGRLIVTSDGSYNFFDDGRGSKVFMITYFGEGDVLANTTVDCLESEVPWEYLFETVAAGAVIVAIFGLLCFVHFSNRTMFSSVSKQKDDEKDLSNNKY